MKKKSLIALLLAVVMCFSLCACGGGNSSEITAMTKEEMLEQATEVQAYDIEATSLENEALGKQNYCNKILKVTGEISEITEDHIEIGGWYVVDAYLPVDELTVLQKNQRVTVVGQTTDKIKGGSSGISHYEMPVAYFVTDHFEVKGIVQTAGIVLVDSEGKAKGNIKTVHWAEGVDKSQYTWQEVTLSAKWIVNDMTGEIEYHDATIVE